MSSFYPVSSRSHASRFSLQPSMNCINRPWICELGRGGCKNLLICDVAPQYFRRHAFAFTFTFTRAPSLVFYNLLKGAHSDYPETFLLQPVSSVSPFVSPLVTLLSTFTLPSNMSPTTASTHFCFFSVLWVMATGLVPTSAVPLDAYSPQILAPQLGDTWVVGENRTVIWYLPLLLYSPPRCIG